MISAVNPLANLKNEANFIEVVYEGIKESRKVVAALRHFIEVDNHKDLVSVKLLQGGTE